MFQVLLVTWWVTPTIFLNNFCLETWCPGLSVHPSEFLFASVQLYGLSACLRYLLSCVVFYKINWLHVYFSVLDLACSDSQLHVQECALSTLHEMVKHKSVLQQLISSKAISKLSQISSNHNPSKSGGNHTARSNHGQYSARSAYSSPGTVSRLHASISQQCALLVKQLQEATTTWHISPRTPVIQFYPVW
jgi:hypothetical protein